MKQYNWKFRGKVAITTLLSMKLLYTLKVDREDVSKLDGYRISIKRVPQKNGRMKIYVSCHERITGKYISLSRLIKNKFDYSDKLQVDI